MFKLTIEFPSNIISVPIHCEQAVSVDLKKLPNNVLVERFLENGLKRGLKDSTFPTLIDSKGKTRDPNERATSGIKACQNKLKKWYAGDLSGSHSNLTELEKEMVDVFEGILKKSGLTKKDDRWPALKSTAEIESACASFKVNFIALGKKAAKVLKSKQTEDDELTITL